MPTPTLSKSRYTAGLQCIKRLWLEVHRYDLIHYGPSQQAVFDQGNQVGEEARRLYPEGILIEEDYLHIPEAIGSTHRAIEKGAKILFEACAENKRVRARTDILVKNEDNTWDMIEVKSVTRVKENHIQDMAIQKWVFDGAGIKIRKSYLCHLNNQYVRRGKLDRHDLFKMADSTGEVKDLMDDIGSRVHDFLTIVDSDQEPVVPIGSHCSRPYDCGLIDHCWKDVPDDSVFSLTNPRGLPDKLFEQGIHFIKDIPETTRLTKNQKAQVQIAKEMKPRWNQKEVNKFIGQLVFPVQFLDFEAWNPAIPPYDGLKPFQKVPFQYSIHVLDSPKSEPIHKEYLAEGTCDPRPELAKRLAGDLLNKGSIVAFHAAYEKSVLHELAELFPEFRWIFQSSIDRMVDLEVPFLNRSIVYPEFQGSSSLKKILPAMIPQMSYQGMEVGDGTQAVAAFTKLTDNTLESSERETIRKNLFQYCNQDTYAMVRLYQVLTETR